MTAEIISSGTHVEVGVEKKGTWTYIMIAKHFRTLVQTSSAQLVEKGNCLGWVLRLFLKDF